MARISKSGRTERNAWVSVESAAPILKAELSYTTDTGKWQDRKWRTLPAAWDAARGKVSGVLPEATAACFFNLVDNRDLVVSSEHEVTL